MQFAVHDINKDILDITVFDKDLFSPNVKLSQDSPTLFTILVFYPDFLGCGRVSLKDLLSIKDSPWEKTVLLENVNSGEISLKIELTLKSSNLLL